MCRRRRCTSPSRPRPPCCDRSSSSAFEATRTETPLSERPEWRQLLDGPVEQVFARFAAQNAALMTRTAALIALGEAAAATDPELAEYRDRAHAETRANLRAFGRRTQPPRCAQRRRQRTIRSRHHLRRGHRRKRLPPPDPRMRLDTGRLRRPHHPHPERPPRENTAFLVRIAAIACSGPFSENGAQLAPAIGKW